MALSEVEVAVAAARVGSAIVRSAYGQEHARIVKSATDVATQTDLDAEGAIMGEIARHRPDDALTGEESGSWSPGVGDRQWLVDPLCGTLNYAAGTPLVAVNVALVSNGGVPAAAVADPIAGELFCTDGHTARLIRGDQCETLRPTSSCGLVDVNCDGPLDAPFVGGQLVADPALRAEFGPRVISSTLALAWVAAGRRAGYVSDGTLRDSVHFAAGIALCQAAGCVVSDLDGNPVHTDRGLIVASDRETHQRLVAIVAPHVRAVRAAT